MTERPRNATWVALLVFLVLPAVVWVHRIHVDRPTGYAVLFNADIFGYFYPTAAFIHRELHAGRLPLWNPYQFAGEPFLGLHVPGALYPPNLLLMGLLSPLRALGAGFVCHTAIAGIFTWLFAARLGLGIPARLVAALAYMLSGAGMLGIYMPAFLATQAWLPAILWALHGLLDEARPRWALALAATLGQSFLAGHAQGFLYELQLAVSYGLFGLVWIARRGRRLRALGLAVVAGLLAAGLVAPQLLPALELTQQGTRSFDGVPLQVAAAGQAGPLGLAWGLVGSAGTSRAGGPFRWLVSLPLLSLPLGLVGLLARRQRATWVFFVGGALAVGLFMLGTETPVYRAYHALPFGGLFRNPTRMAFIYALLAGMVAAIGVQALGERVEAAFGRRAALVAGVLVVAVTAVELYARTRVGYGHPILGPQPSGALADLTAFAESRPGDPRIFVEPSPVAAKPLLGPKAGTLLGIRVVPDYEPNLPAIYRTYFDPSEPVWHGKVTLPAPASGGDAERLRRLLDLMSVRYYAALLPRPEREAALHEFAAGPEVPAGDVRVFERPAALPRAYTVRRTLVAPDVASSVERLLADGFDPRREAVVVAPAVADGALAALDGTADARLPADSVEIARDEPGAVTIDVTTHARALLVLTDLHYPGWQASVDGRPATVHLANAIFRGVVLDAGTHRVAFRYAPWSFRLGGWLFAAALVGAIVVAGADRRARPTPR